MPSFEDEMKARMQVRGKQRADRDRKQPPSPYHLPTSNSFHNNNQINISNKKVITANNLAKSPVRARLSSRASSIGTIIDDRSSYSNNNNDDANSNYSLGESEIENDIINRYSQEEDYDYDEKNDDHGNDNDDHGNNSTQPGIISGYRNNNYYGGSRQDFGTVPVTSRSVPFRNSRMYNNNGKAMGSMQSRSNDDDLDESGICGCCCKSMKGRILTSLLVIALALTILLIFIIPRVPVIRIRSLSIPSEVARSFGSNPGSFKLPLLVTFTLENTNLVPMNVEKLSFAISWSLPRSLGEIQLGSGSVTLVSDASIPAGSKVSYELSSVALEYSARNGTRDILINDFIEKCVANPTSVSLYMIVTITFRVAGIITVTPPAIIVNGALPCSISLSELPTGFISSS